MCFVPLPLNNVLKATALALYLQGLNKAQVAQRTGVKVNTLNTWVSREQWNARRAQVNANASLVVDVSRELPKHMLPAVSHELQEASARLRGTLASVLESNAGVLSAKPATSVSQVILRANAVKATVDAGDKLHGWSAQASAPAWNVTILDRSLPSCVSDTPTGSVPAQLSDHSMPQDAQVIDVESSASA